MRILLLNWEGRSMNTDADNNDGAPPRKRRVTDLALQWLAQRLRKSQQIKERVDNGTYAVDSSKVAASIANEE